MMNTYKSDLFGDILYELLIFSPQGKKNKKIVIKQLNIFYSKVKCDCTVVEIYSNLVIFSTILI